MTNQYNFDLDDLFEKTSPETEPHNVLNTTQDSKVASEKKKIIRTSSEQGKGKGEQANDTEGLIEKAEQVNINQDIDGEQTHALELKRGEKEDFEMKGDVLNDFLLSDDENEPNYADSDSELVCDPNDFEFGLELSSDEEDGDKKIPEIEQRDEEEQKNEEKKMEMEGNGESGVEKKESEEKSIKNESLEKTVPVENDITMNKETEKNDPEESEKDYKEEATQIDEQEKNGEEGKCVQLENENVKEENKAESDILELNKASSVEEGAKGAVSQKNEVFEDKKNSAPEKASDERNDDVCTENDASLEKVQTKKEDVNQTKGEESKVPERPIQESVKKVGIKTEIVENKTDVKVDIEPESDKIDIPKTKFQPDSTNICTETNEASLNFGVVDSCPSPDVDQDPVHPKMKEEVDSFPPSELEEEKDGNTNIGNTFCKTDTTPDKKEREETPFSSEEKNVEKISRSESIESNSNDSSGSNEISDSYAEYALMDENDIFEIEKTPKKTVQKEEFIFDDKYEREYDFGVDFDEEEVGDGNKDITDVNVENFDYQEPERDSEDDGINIDPKDEKVTKEDSLHKQKEEVNVEEKREEAKNSENVLEEGDRLESDEEDDLFSDEEDVVDDTDSKIENEITPKRVDNEINEGGVKDIQNKDINGSVEDELFCENQEVAITLGKDQKQQEESLFETNKKMNENDDDEGTKIIENERREDTKEVESGTTEDDLVGETEIEPVVTEVKMEVKINEGKGEIENTDSDTLDNLFGEDEIEPVEVTVDQRKVETEVQKEVRKIPEKKVEKETESKDKSELENISDSEDDLFSDDEIEPVEVTGDQRKVETEVQKVVLKIPEKKVEKETESKDKSELENISDSEDDLFSDDEIEPVKVTVDQREAETEVQKEVLKIPEKKVEKETESGDKPELENISVDTDTEDELFSDTENEPVKITVDEQEVEPEKKQTVINETVQIEREKNEEKIKKVVVEKPNIIEESKSESTKNTQEKEVIEQDTSDSDSDDDIFCDTDQIVPVKKVIESKTDEMKKNEDVNLVSVAKSNLNLASTHENTKVNRNVNENEKKIENEESDSDNDFFDDASEEKTDIKNEKKEIKILPKKVPVMVVGKSLEKTDVKELVKSDSDTDSVFEDGDGDKEGHLDSIGKKTVIVSPQKKIMMEQVQGKVLTKKKEEVGIEKVKQSENVVGIEKVKRSENDAYPSDYGVSESMRLYLELEEEKKRLIETNRKLSMKVEETREFATTYQLLPPWILFKKYLSAFSERVSSLTTIKEQLQVDRKEFNKFVKTHDKPKGLEDFYERCIIFGIKVDSCFRIFFEDMSSEVLSMFNDPNYERDKVIPKMIADLKEMCKIERHNVFDSVIVYNYRIPTVYIKNYFNSEYGECKFKYLFHKGNNFLVVTPLAGFDKLCAIVRKQTHIIKFSDRNRNAAKTTLKMKIFTKEERKFPKRLNIWFQGYLEDKNTQKIKKKKRKSKSKGKAIRERKKEYHILLNQNDYTELFEKDVNGFTIFRNIQKESGVERLSVMDYVISRKKTDLQDVMKIFGLSQKGLACVGDFDDEQDKGIHYNDRFRMRNLVYIIPLENMWFIKWLPNHMIRVTTCVIEYQDEGDLGEALLQLSDYSEKITEREQVFS